MGIFTLLAIALSLSVDALAVSVANGVALGGRRRFAAALAMGLAFGLFQGLMPLTGYYAGELVGGGFLQRWSGWVAFVLLGVIGGKMIWESFKGGGEAAAFRLTFKLLLAQAVATSIDALAVGVSFAGLAVNIWLAAPLIAAITFAVAIAGALFGERLGRVFEKRAGLVGGAALVLIGVKTLVF